MVMSLANTMRPIGTTDPAIFDWFAFVGLPVFFGLATVTTAIAAIVIAVQANNRGKEAIARQLRYDFGQAFLRYARTPSAATAMGVKWPEAMTEDAAVERIPQWFQEQRSDVRVSSGLLEMSVEARLIEWVKSGKFRDEPIMNADGSLVSI